MAQVWKVRLPYSTHLKGVGVAPAAPYLYAYDPKLPWPQLEQHHWLALGALGSAALGVVSLLLAARGRTTAATTLAVLTAITGGLTGAISHLNAPVRAAQDRAELERTIQQAIRGQSVLV